MGWCVEVIEEESQREERDRGPKGRWLKMVECGLQVQMLRALVPPMNFNPELLSDFP